MTNKSLTIAFIAFVVILGAAIGTWLGLRSRQAPPSSPPAPAVTAQPSTQESYLPSREYVEGRARAFKQLREETLKAQYQRENFKR